MAFFIRNYAILAIHVAVVLARQVSAASVSLVEVLSEQRDGVLVSVKGPIFNKTFLVNEILSHRFKESQNH